MLIQKDVLRVKTVFQLRRETVLVGMDRRLRGAPLVFAFLVCVLTALLQEAKSEATAGEGT